MSRDLFHCIPCCKICSGTSFTSVCFIKYISFGQVVTYFIAWTVKYVPGTYSTDYPVVKYIWSGCGIFYSVVCEICPRTYFIEYPVVKYVLWLLLQVSALENISSLVKLWHILWCVLWNMSQDLFYVVPCCEICSGISFTSVCFIKYVRSWCDIFHCLDCELCPGTYCILAIAIKNFPVCW